MKEIVNSFTVTGNILNLNTMITSNDVIINAIDNLMITKSANKSIWENGILTYTITITNNSDNIITNNFSDIINPSYASLITNLVFLNNNVPSFNYNKLTGLLEINDIIINPNESVIISYSVSKKSNDFFVLNNTATFNNIKSNTVKVTSILIRNCNNFAKR